MRITVDLRRDEYERLQQLALVERRPLRDQAAILIERALETRTDARQNAAVPA